MLLFVGNILFTSFCSALVLVHFNMVLDETFYALR